MAFAMRQSYRTGELLTAAAWNRDVLDNYDGLSPDHECRLRATERAALLGVLGAVAIAATLIGVRLGSLACVAYCATFVGIFSCAVVERRRRAKVAAVQARMGGDEIVGKDDGQAGVTMPNYIRPRP